MKIDQRKWTPSNNWQSITTEADPKKASLVFVFGSRFLLKENDRFEEIKRFYPNAHIALASTSGNILGTNIDDQSLVVTAIEFSFPSSSIEVQRTNIVNLKNSFESGKLIGGNLTKENLKHVFLLSDGHLVNGSELVKGVLSTLPSTVALTGGLAGDGTRFEKTIVGLDEIPKEGEIVAIGFYGDNIKCGYGSVGGWDPFGIERKITRSKGNILYELDGKSALELYKKYLGEQAKDLPSSALFFPLAIRPDRLSKSLVRTILSINDNDQGMVFAGDLPEGWYGQLMKANFDRLVDGASQAANSSYEMLGKQIPDLAILISCVGRRLVLDQRTEEEIESVQDIIGKKTILTGFYSYGEIAPTSPNANCELHNQTMTITTLSER